MAGVYIKTYKTEVVFEMYGFHTTRKMHVAQPSIGLRSAGTIQFLLFNKGTNSCISLLALKADIFVVLSPSFIENKLKVAITGTHSSLLPGDQINAT